ncbi:IS66 family transposase [Sulfidibacter corallicola]|uniref:IS66 family transposase n=1 Tax=Sulfidibacter corallicola TaxID=2818388 RepID=A0A8A4TP84_SULCO|nr:IS66 family transposase [Sulfidibacter corallicola]QTD50711.1 IS66 family transposase [Sulfidibacter corallicola]
MIKENVLDFVAKQPELAKKVVRSLESEVVRLQKKLAKATGYDGETGLLEEVAEWLVAREHENEILKDKLYGRSAEPHPHSDSADSSPKAKSPSKRSRKKPPNSGRRKHSDELPVETEDYTLSSSPCDLPAEAPADSPCPCGCAQPLKPMGQAEVTYQLDYKPAQFIVRRVRRWKYSGPCGTILTAPGRTTLVDKGQYGIDLAAEICVRKYHDHMPFERLARAFARDGFAIATSTMWNQSRHVADVLSDVYEAIRRDIESGFLRHADETRWRIIEGVDNKTQYVWLFRNQNHAFFTIEDTRSGEVPRRVMGGAAGALVADDYAGYNALVSENELLRVQCWAHTRRRFYDIREYYPAVEVFLDLVADLYRLDRGFRAGALQTAKQRRRLCEPIIKAIDAWRKSQTCLPKSKMGQALAYMNDNWKGLTAFLDDPELPLDNNPAENALRQIVLGRKNFMFNPSKEGARVTAILYTICVSCAMCGVNPKDYIRETVLRIRNCRGFQLPIAFANQREHCDLI